MEPISKLLASAFYNKSPRKIGNHEVRVSETTTTLILFSNIVIAEWENGKSYILITDGGWFSDVAKELLDALLLRTKSRIEIQKKVWHLRDISTGTFTKMQLNGWYKININH